MERGIARCDLGRQWPARGRRAVWRGRPACPPARRHRRARGRQTQRPHCGRARCGRGHGAWAAAEASWRRRGSERRPARARAQIGGTARRAQRYLLLARAREGLLGPGEGRRGRSFGQTGLGACCRSGGAAAVRRAAGRGGCGGRRRQWRCGPAQRDNASGARTWRAVAPPRPPPRGIPMSSSQVCYGCVCGHFRRSIGAARRGAGPNPPAITTACGGAKRRRGARLPVAAPVGAAPVRGLTVSRGSPANAPLNARKKRAAALPARSTATAGALSVGARSRVPDLARGAERWRGAARGTRPCP
jgi:hypothetical protein